MKLHHSIRNAPYAMAAAATLAMMSVQEAAAQAGGGGGTSTVGDAAKQIMGQVTNVGKLSVATAFLLGIIMVAGGLLKLKQASENQGQNPPYSAGLWRLALGAGLVALPALTSMLTQSTVGTGVTITPAADF